MAKVSVGARNRVGWLVGTAAALAAAIVPATAGGVPRSEVDPGFYGGGRILPSTARSERDSAVMSLRVAADRRSLRFYTEARMTCSPELEGVRVRTKEVSLRTPIRANGTFNTEREFQTGFETRPSVVNATFSGRFDSRGRVRGIFEMTQQIRSATGEVLTRCGSGRVTWRAVHPRVLPAAGRPVRGESYFGNTSQIGTQLATDTPRFGFKFPIMLRVNLVRSLSHVIFYWRSNCQSGPGIPLRKTIRGISARLPTDGRFSFQVTDTEDLGPREVESRTLSIAGRIGRNRASGTLNVRTVVRNKEDQQVNARCDTGRVRWRAERYG